MSNLETTVETLIVGAFPLFKYKRQKYVNYQNTQLLFDFVLPELKVLIEVQGEQHFTYNKFYHGTKAEFDKQKFRDNLKVQWATENNYTLICVDSKQVNDFTVESFKQFIVENM